MEIRSSAKKTAKSFLQIVPMIAGVLLLVSLLTAAIPEEAYAALFTGHPVLDPLVGAAAGSVAAGNPVTSYVIGGELLRVGVSLTAVTAFIVAWVSVGLVSLPAEMEVMGRRFALARNAISFLCAVLMAVLVVLVLSGLGASP
ncbi:hypothetical protein E2N92_08495 [Methanofollis formosanus]|uniref:Permease n=1 Tax=Methanofollis formosanus TaxID=299308 RepID=A0A8G1A1I7_9EURY|nr:hypothetical protein [Methanofollis formosanus]QYZ79462.1 hypothetical protein E2N92_08495 [Methanofollis formosanus]